MNPKRGPTEGVMSIRDDYDIDQWTSISTAPLAVGLAILFADTRAVGIDACSVIVRQAITRPASGASSELVRVLVESWRTEDVRIDGLLPADRNRGDTQNALIVIARSAVLAVESKSPTEAEPFKTWLATIAARILRFANVAAASGPQPGSISAAERKTTDQLAGVLGVRLARECGNSHLRPDHQPSM
jgi:hypothetical protein